MNRRAESDRPSPSRTAPPAPRPPAEQVGARERARAEGRDRAHRAAAPTAPATYLPDEDRWEWSETLTALLGFSPGELPPSTGALAAHADEAGRDALAAWTGAEAEPGEHARVHLLRCGDREMVVLASWTVPPAPGAARPGRFVDLTSEVGDRAAAVAGEHIRAGLESRSRVDQAVGVLLAAYGLDPDAGFDLLRWFSTRRNEKLRAIAERLVQGHHQVPGVAFLDPGRREALLNALVLGTDLPGAGDVGPVAGAGVAAYEVGRCGEGPVLRVAGTVDLARTPRLVEQLDALGAAAGPGEDVYLDLSAAHPCAAALVELERFVTRARRRGTVVRVVPRA